jgi:hypothetical protein
MRLRKNGKVDKRSDRPRKRAPYEVLLAVDRDLWGLVRQCAVREEIPVYKIVEEALATRIRWSQQGQLGLVRPHGPTMGELAELTKAFHQGKGKARF